MAGGDWRTEPARPHVMEQNGIELCPYPCSPQCPCPVPQCTLFPHACPCPRARKHFKCDIANIWKKYCSATSEFTYCNIRIYLLQHRKICTATSKFMYCNIEKTCAATLKKHVLQPSKIMCHNIEIYVMQHLK